MFPQHALPVISLILCNLVVGYPKELDVSKFGSPAFATNQPTVFALPDLGSLPHSLALGTVGMPGYVSPIFYILHLMICQKT